MKGVVHFFSREITLGRRNRLILGLGSMTFFLSLILAYFGTIQNPGAEKGVLGFSSFEATVISLTALSTYLIPIIALVLGFDSTANEMETGSFELFFTYPLKKSEIYFGKFLGLATLLVVSTTTGFLVAGLIIGWKIGWESFGIYLNFVLASNLLGLTFLALSFFFSNLVEKRAQMLGLNLFSWFFFVILFDLGLILLLVALEGRVPQEVASAVLFLNPADLFRFMSTATIENIRNSYGIAAVVAHNFFSLKVLILTLALWVALPLCGGYLLFKRRSIKR